MDINDIIDSIYKLPDASKEALLSDAPEVAYPKGFHLIDYNGDDQKRDIDQRILQRNRRSQCHDFLGQVPVQPDIFPGKLKMKSVPI